MVEEESSVEAKGSSGFLDKSLLLPLFGFPMTEIIIRIIIACGLLQVGDQKLASYLLREEMKPEQGTLTSSSVAAYTSSLAVVDAIAGDFEVDARCFPSG